MRVSFISIPYDLGRFDCGTGKGPAGILDKTLIDQLKRRGHVVDEQTVLLPEDESLTDLQTAFRLNSLIAKAVEQTVEKGSFPFILAGSCISSAGALSGLPDNDVGVLWLDAHGDFNTPETTRSGYLDGMALSFVCGRCWKTLAASDPSYRAVSDDRVVLLGARDFDPAETEELHRSNVTVVTVENARRNGWSVLKPRDSRGRDLFIHFDADVLDVSIGRASIFACAGGLLPNDVEQLLSSAIKDYNLQAFSITAYNPEFDMSGSIRNVLRAIILSVIEKMAQNE
jgi:arginase